MAQLKAKDDVFVGEVGKARGVFQALQVQEGPKACEALTERHTETVANSGSQADHYGHRRRKSSARSLGALQRATESG